MTGIEIIIIGIVASIAITAFLFVLSLALKKLISWIRTRGEIASRGEIGFILKEKLKSGKYKVVNGVFNKNINEVTDYEARQASQIDKDLEEQDDLVLYS